MLLPFPLESFQVNSLYWLHLLKYSSNLKVLFEQELDREIQDEKSKVLDAEEVVLMTG